MNIAIDFDDTFSADEDLWREFIRQAESRGHRVYIVTCRHSNHEMRVSLFDIDDDELRSIKTNAIIKRTGLPVYRHHFTGMAPKRYHMEQAGIPIDIWIDDTPECIEHGR